MYSIGCQNTSVFREKKQQFKISLVTKHREISSVLCAHLEGWDREGGREIQEGGDMGIYVYV